MRAKTKGRSSVNSLLRRGSRRRGVLSGPHRERSMTRARSMGTSQNDANGEIEERRKQDEVDDDEQREGARDGRGIHRGDGLCRAHLPVDDPRLTTRFGHSPARQYRDEAERTGESTDEAEPARVVQPPAPAQP